MENENDLPGVTVERWSPPVVAQMTHHIALEARRLEDKHRGGYVAIG